jgi:uncharacterized protein (UPF0332 family)
MRDLALSRLAQAGESLAEAKALLEAGMDAPLVLASLYLAFYYPLIALVHGGRVPETLQSVTIGLFEQRFITTGKISRLHLDAVRRAFALKPKCGGGAPEVGRDEIDRLILQADAFITEIGAAAAERR